MEGRSSNGAAFNSSGDHERSDDGAQVTMNNTNANDPPDVNPESSGSPRTNSQRTPSSNSQDRPPESDPGIIVSVLHTNQPVLVPSSPIDIDNSEEEENRSVEGGHDEDGAGGDSVDAGSDSATAGATNENSLAGSSVVGTEHIHSEPDDSASDQQKFQEKEDAGGSDVDDDDGDDDGGDDDDDDDEQSREGDEDGDMDSEQVVVREEVVVVSDEDADAERETFEEDDVVTDDDANANANMSSEVDLSKTEMEIEWNEATVIIETGTAVRNDSESYRSADSEDDNESGLEGSEMEELGDTTDDLKDEAGNAMEDDNSLNPDRPESSSQAEDANLSQVERLISDESTEQFEDSENPDAKDDTIPLSEGDDDFVEDDDSGEANDFSESDVEQADVNEDNEDNDGIVESPEDTANESSTGAEVGEADVHKAAVSPAARGADDVATSSPQTSSMIVPMKDDAVNEPDVEGSLATAEPQNESRPADSSATERVTTQNESLITQPATGGEEDSGQSPPISDGAPPLPSAKEPTPVNPSPQATLAPQDKSESAMTADGDLSENPKNTNLEGGAVTQASIREEDRMSLVIDSSTKVDPPEPVEPTSRPSQPMNQSTPTDPAHPMPSSVSDPISTLTVELQSSSPQGTTFESDVVMDDTNDQPSQSQVGDSVSTVADPENNDKIIVGLSDNLEKSQDTEMDAVSMDTVSVAKDGTPGPSSTITGSEASAVNKMSGDNGPEDMEIKLNTNNTAVLSSSTVAQTDDTTDTRKKQSTTSVSLADNQQLLQINNTSHIKQEFERPDSVAGESQDKSSLPHSQAKESIGQESKRVLPETNTDMDRSDDMKGDQSAGLTAPMFGINPVQKSVKEQRPVSFSAPPTFHSINPKPPTDSKVPSVLRHPESCAGDDTSGQSIDRQDGSSAGPVKKHVTFAETIQEFPISPVKKSGRAKLLPPTKVSLSSAVMSDTENDQSGDKNIEEAPMSPLNDEDGVGTESDGGSRRLSNQRPKPGSPASISGKEPPQIITDKQNSDGQRCVEVTNVHISVKSLTSSKRLVCPVSTIRFTLKKDDPTIEFIHTDSETAGTWETLSPLVNYKGVKRVRKPEYAIVVVVGSIGVDETKRYYLRCQEGSYETIFRLLHDITPSTSPPSRTLLTGEVGDITKRSNGDSNTQTSDPAAITRVEPGGPSPSSSGPSGSRNITGPKPDISRKGAGLKRQASQLGDGGDNIKADKKARVDQNSKSAREEKKRASAAILMNKRKELLAQMMTKDTPASTESTNSRVGDLKSGLKTAPAVGTTGLNEAGNSASQLRRSSGLITHRSPKSSAVENTAADARKSLNRREEHRVRAHNREATKSAGTHVPNWTRSGSSAKRSDGLRFARQSTGGRSVRQNTRTDTPGSSSLQAHKTIFKAMKMHHPPPNDGAEILSEIKGVEQEAMLSEDVRKLEKSLAEKRRANEGELMKVVSREVARALKGDRSSQRAKLRTSYQLALEKALAPWKKQKALEDDRKNLEAGCVSEARPDSPEDFFARLHTFRPVTWPEFDAQSPIGPVECALRGWRNEGMGRLVSSEGSKITVDFCDLYGVKTRAATLSSLRNAIEGAGHSLLSVWIGRKCPESFRTVDGSQRGMSSEEIRKIAEELRTRNVEDLVKIGRTVDDGAWSVPGLQEDECMKLACCNWRLDGVECMDLWCNWCNRRVPIIPKCVLAADKDSIAPMPFHPQRSHFNFCPFASPTGPAVHVGALGIAKPEAALRNSQSTDNSESMNGEH